MCPPDSDQTCRSAQRWQILAPRLRQGHKLRPRNESYTSTRREVLFQQDKSWDAWSKLAKPVDFSFLPPRAPFPEPSYRAKTAAVSRSILECLPAELLKMVFDDEVLEKQDIVALGLCSQIFWQHMLRHVESVYRKFAAPWAGTEIACTGTYLTDLPESFEKDNLAMDTVIDKNWPAYMVLARRFNWAAWSEFQPPPENQQDAWRSALHVHRNTAAIPDSHWPKLEEDILCGNLFPQIHPHLFPNLPPRSPGWVLRNLTTKEYVRMCASSRHKGEYAVLNAPWLRLDDVLIMSICWTSSSNPLPDLKSGIDLNRGKWAGHRFEIVMVEASSAEADGWKDATGEMVSEARELRHQIRSSLRGRDKETLFEIW
jgi:hypothetical protein